MAWFATSMSVTQAQLEDKLGRPASDWTPGDVASLRVISTSLQRGETTVADEFPKPTAPRLTAAEITGAIDQQGA